MTPDTLSTAVQLDTILICDPLCLQEAGHNLAAVNRYAGYFRSHGVTPRIYASKLIAGIGHLVLPEDTAYIYTHYYSKTIPTPNATQDMLSQRIRDSDNIEADKLIRELAFNEIREIVESVNRPFSSAIYFPSIDYYSFDALVRLLEQAPQLNYPSFFIRWIGVMEHCYYSSNNDNTLESLCRRISIITANNPNLRIRYSTETRAFASQMRRLLCRNIVVTPTLVDDQALPIKSNSIFSFCFPGAARMDKGYNRIPAILESINSRYPNLDYLVYLQMPSFHELHQHYDIVREIMKNPRVRMYPSHVRQSCLTDYIASSHLIITPYCSQTYKYRSSAIMAEAACFGRQVVASSGCGFSDDILDLSLGVCSASIDGFADAIYRYSTLSPSEMQCMVQSARTNYLQHAIDSYLNFFQLKQ